MMLSSTAFRYRSGGGISLPSYATPQTDVDTSSTATTTVSGGSAHGSDATTTIESYATSSPLRATTTPRKSQSNDDVGFFIPGIQTTSTVLADSYRKLEGQVLGASTESICTDMQYHLEYGATDVTTHGEVSELQYYLKEKGYFNAKVTGVFAEITEDALKRYQKDNDILVTGIAGKITRTKIKNLECRE
jgi:hypothetical protein